MAENATILKRVHAIYSGAVQGVGFRYTSERVANSLGLSGWARNLTNGHVELTCEGPEDDVKVFLAKIADIFKTYIVETKLEWENPTGEKDGFNIRF